MVLSTFRPEYLPSLEYFWNMAQCDTVILTDHLQYTKRSPVSISAPLNKPDDCLRIPVAHDQVPKAISEKKISSVSNWSKKHFSTIYHQYHNYPYAYYYLPLIETFFQDPNVCLSRHLHLMTEKFGTLLHLGTRLQLSSTLDHNRSADTLIHNWCTQEGSEKYIAAAEVFDNGWINKEKLQKNGIECCRFKPFPDAHIFTSFRSLSVLGFLCQFGPEAGYLIRQYMPGDH